MSHTTRFIAGLKSGDYFISNPNGLRNPILDQVYENSKGILTAFPIATKKSNGKWSYRNDFGTPILEEVGQALIDEDLFRKDDILRKVSKEELAFILLQCENNNEI